LRFLSHPRGNEREIFRRRRGEAETDHGPNKERREEMQSFDRIDRVHRINRIGDVELNSGTDHGPGIMRNTRLRLDYSHALLVIGAGGGKYDCP
jgi:hypothetical protein